MNEFYDSDLRQQLADLSGPFPDDNMAFAAWQRRVGQARRRRAVGWITGAAVSLIVGTVAVAALQRSNGHSLVPSQPAETSAEPTTTAMPTTESRESSTTESTTTATRAPTTTSAPETTVSAAFEALPVPLEPAVTEASGSPGTAGPSTEVGGSPTSDAPDEALASTQSFSSGGGSITVHHIDERLTVVGTDPAPGYRAKETDGSGQRVQVTFRSGGHAFEIIVRLVDGVMQHSVSEDSENQDTVPDDTSGGDEDGGDGDDDGEGDGDGGDN